MILCFAYFGDSIVFWSTGDVYKPSLKAFDHLLLPQMNVGYRWVGIPGRISANAVHNIFNLRVDAGEFEEVDRECHVRSCAISRGFVAN